MFIEIQNQNFFEVITLVITFTAIFGHNLWLVGREQTTNEAKLEINTGDDFPSGEVAIKPERIKDFSIYTEAETVKIDNFHVEETSLIASFENKSNSSFVAAIELFPHSITLEAEKFAHYIEDEDAEIFTKPDFIIGETSTPQRESYAKFAKVLVGEDSDVFTKVVGHRLEIVLVEKTANKLKVKVLLEGNPANNLRVSSGLEGINGGRYLNHTRTDENGLAEIEIMQNGHWYLRTHLIRHHSETENFEWESFWASITFRII